MGSSRLVWLEGKKFVGIDSSEHSIVISSQDLDNAIGMKPSDLLLLGLAGCTAVDVVGILKKKKQDVHAMEIIIDSEQDENPPWKFKSIHLTYRIRGVGISEKAVETAIELSETKYCSIAASLKPQVEITTEYVVIEEPEE